MRGATMRAGPFCGQAASRRSRAHLMQKRTLTFDISGGEKRLRSTLWNVRSMEGLGLALQP